MDSEPEYHPHSYFNFYPASGTNNSQQTENCDVPQSEQKDTLPKHTGGSKNAEQHLGTEQCTPKYPGTSQHFLKHPGTNRFSTQEIRRAHHKPPSPGANQHSALHPRNTQCFTPHLGQYQFGKTTHYKGTGKFPGPPLYTSYLGTAEYPGTSKQYVGRMLYDTGSQFPQMVTPLSDVHGQSAPEKTRARIYWEALVRAFLVTLTAKSSETQVQNLKISTHFSLLVQT